MLPSLRKKPEAAASVVPAWHPNFRDFERLPDTKVIRTSFFINGLALLVAAAVGLIFGYQEYQRYTLSQQIDNWDRQIQSHQAAGNAAVANFRKFQAEEKKLKEVGAFLERKVAPSELLLRLGETLPPDIVLNYVDLRATGVTLRGVVRGTPGEASGKASAYVTKLQQDAKLGPAFESVVMTSMARQATTGELSIEIQLRLSRPKS